MNTDFFYNFPQMVYLLLLVPIFGVLYYFLFNYRKNVLNNLASQPILDQILYPRPTINFIRKAIFFILCWILATLALMDPQGNARYPETQQKVVPLQEKSSKQKRRVHEIIFLMDASPSMTVKDMPNGLSRFDNAKEIVEETLQRLDGQMISIYTFTSDIDKLVPSSLDYFYARLAIRNLVIDKFDAGGTNLKKAVESILNDYPASPNEKPKTLIILSDGGDILYEKSSSPQKTFIENTFSNLGKEAFKKNVHIYSISLGSLQGGEIPPTYLNNKKITSKMDPNLLKILATQSGGDYYEKYEEKTPEIVDKLIQKINKRNRYLEDYEKVNKVYLSGEGDDFIYDRYYQKFLLFSMIALILLFLPENWKKETP